MKLKIYSTHIRTDHPVVYWICWSLPCFVFFSFVLLLTIPASMRMELLHVLVISGTKSPRSGVRHMTLVVSLWLWEVSWFLYTSHVTMTCMSVRLCKSKFKLWQLLFCVVLPQSNRSCAYDHLLLMYLNAQLFAQPVIGHCGTTGWRWLKNI